MSETEPTPAPEAPPPPAPRPAPPPPRPARWVDRLSALFMLAAAAVTAAAAAPALLRAAGAPIPEGRAPEGKQPLDLRHAPPEILANPDRIFDPDVDVDDPPTSAPFALAQGKIGRVVGTATLRDRPADAGKVIGTARPGELVMVMRESGEWLQVWAQIDDTTKAAWTKKSGIAIR